MHRRKIFGKFILSVCLIVFMFASNLLCPFANLSSAQAEENYLSVTSENLSVCNCKQTSTYYLISLEYNGTGVLPNATSSMKYNVEDKGLETDDSDILQIYVFQAYSATKLNLAICETPTEEGKTGYTEAAPTVIRIPKGTIYKASDTSKGAGICFTDGLTLVYDETAELPWSVEVLPTVKEIGFGLVQGATIRCDKDMASSGIRFSAELSETAYAAYEGTVKGLGIIVMPSDKIGGAEFTLDNYGGSDQAKNFYLSADKIAFKEGKFRLSASIVTVLESNYNRSFSARAYVLITRDGRESYIWEETYVSRSVYEVATAALEDGTEKYTTTQTKILETYVNGVANITFDGENVQVVCAAEVPAVTAVTVRESEGKTVLSLATDRTAFEAITYNGKRIRNAEQTYADGILTVVFETV